MGKYHRIDTRSLQGKYKRSEGVRKWGDGCEEATGGVVKDVKGSY